MKLHQLRDLVAIADHGSLRAAARHLGMAQPTLTRSLSELERELGAPLFERRSKGMAATALGQAFIRRSIAILNDVRHATEEFEQLRGNATGSVAIGLSIVAHLRLFTKTLRAFRRSYPRVRLHVIEGFYPSLELGLQDGSVDFYIGPGPDLAAAPGLHTEILFPGRRAVLARVGHPLARATSLKELVDAEWITTSITAKAENELGDLFKRYGLPAPTLALQCQSALTLLTSLANSDLLAMAPSQWIESAFANHILTTIPIKEEITAPSIVVVKRSDVPLSPAAGHLLDLMKRAAGNVEAPRPLRTAGAARRAGRSRAK
ncbi:MAG TPA: LysR substrate-binding domain-containing protein [Rhizomicrobium sp.]|nr:LysR substrate-binding domain-containing protein [Rhizomicrobium sp.]